jgi:hypothetical protein
MLSAPYQGAHQVLQDFDISLRFPRCAISGVRPKPADVSQPTLSSQIRKREEEPGRPVRTHQQAALNAKLQIEQRFTPPESTNCAGNVFLAINGILGSAPAALTPIFWTALVSASA